MLRAKFSTLDKGKSGKKILRCSHEQLYVYVLSKGNTCLWREGHSLKLPSARLRKGPFSNREHWECSQAAFYKKLLWTLTLTFILISLGPSYSWADLFTLNSPVLCKKEKVHSQFVQCNRGSGIQCRSTLLVPSTQSVLKFLQLNYIILIFRKGRRAWFYHFQHPLKYTAHKLNK